MVEKSLSYKKGVLKQEYKFQGVYDHEKLYKGIIEWFKGHGFLFQEKVHKFKPPELELEFECTRKDTGYKKTVIGLKYHAWYWKKVKVKKGDKEREMIDTRFQIIITIDVIYDYDKRYKGWLLEKLQKLMHDVVLFYKFNIFDWDKAHLELLELHKKIKNMVDSSTGEGAW